MVGHFSFGIYFNPKTNFVYVYYYEFSMNDLEDKIRSLMTKKRFRHVKETLRIAEDISEKYSIDKEKIKQTALLHDIAKDIPKEKMKDLKEKYGIVWDSIEEKEKGLWHGAIGASIVEERFKIKDPEILEAIKFHSTGMPNMSLLFKILYISDYLETCTDKEIKGIAKGDIESVLKMVIAKKINYVLQKGSLLHPRTVSLWNSLC